MGVYTLNLYSYSYAFDSVNEYIDESRIVKDP